MTKSNMNTTTTILAVGAAAALLLASPVSAFVAPGSRTLSSQNLRQYGRSSSSSSTYLALKTTKQEVKDQQLKVIDDTEISNSYDPFSLGDQNGGPSTVAESVESEEQQQQIMGIWAARGLLLFVAMLWGTNFASVKYLETLCFHPPCNHPPSEAALARFGIAALVSFPLLIGQRMDIIKAGFECGLWITLGYITQAMALQSIPSGKCAFICSLTVVVVPLLSAFFGKPIKAINVASAAVALTGVGVLEGLIDVSALVGGAQPALADSSDVVMATALTSSTMTEAASTVVDTGVLTKFATSIGVTKGDLLALGQPFGFGLSFMRIEHYVEKFEDVENRIMTISAAQCVTVGLCSLLWVLHDFNGTIPDFGYMLEWHRIVAILWTGIMTTVVAIYLEGFALQVASATEAALTFASEPVWASLFGAWLLREQLGPTSYVGGAIILMACVIGALADLVEDGDDAQMEA